MFKIRKRDVNAPKQYVKVKLKKDDVVKIIAGKDKGKSGRVLDIDRRTGRVLVEGVSMVKRHTRPNPSKQIKGGIAERESTISVSNVMILTSGGVATRIAYRMETSGAGTRRVRIAKKGGEILDKKA
ncbi:MAG TPA: 50S ribosomal protein L24 [Bryobacteraceae bacterium]|nr:50S ribosomal protein L24 [Bryobacteraceae bacterium]